MGEAKFRQYGREQFLKTNPKCCYCAADALTTDHCPPRGMFFNRIWPEGYEFPACHECNQESRRDEQVLAMLNPMWFSKEQTAAEEEQWRRHTKSVHNNQPEILQEIMEGTGRNVQKREFRRLFGNDIGDALRNKGYAAGNIGPLIKRVIKRFSVKLSKALFYKHTGVILDGYIWTIHFTSANNLDVKSMVETMLKIAPIKPVTSRSGKDLDNQFTYRYNSSDGPEPILYAVVQFNDQLMFNITAASNSFVESVGGSMGVLDKEPMVEWKVDARL